MTSWNGSRRKGLRDLGECWFRCADCPTDEKKWWPGGQEGLKKHRRLWHGIDEWPDYRTVDSDRFLLDHDGARVMRDGEPVRAPEDVSWIKTRPTKPRLYDRGRS